MDFSCAILAGGQSRRFGSDKTIAKLKGKSFTEILARKFVKISDDVMIISKNSSKFDFNLSHVRFLNDIYESQCPLVGILTSMKYAKYDWIFVVSADSPFVKIELIHLLSENLENCDVLLPYIRDKIYTLSSFYNKRIFKVFDDFFKKGVLRLLDIYPHVKTCYFRKVEKIKCIDNDLVSFININTKEDYEFAKQIAEKIDF